jgi:hypothetical protein
LHLFSRVLVESKREGRSYESIANGESVTEDVLLTQPSAAPIFGTTQIQRPPKAQPFQPVFNGFGATEQTPREYNLIFEPPLPVLPSSASQGAIAQVETHSVTAPVPQRAMKSPILNFENPVPSQQSPFATTATPDSRKQEPAFATPPKLQFSASFKFDAPPSFRIPLPIANEEPPLIQSISESPVTQASPPPEKKIDQARRETERQSIFERQEEMLKDELARQHLDRRLKLESEEQERKKVLEISRQLTAERERVRAKRAAELEQQKHAAKEDHERQRAMAAKRKQEKEKAVERFTDEIVTSIIREHILEVSATMLAIEFDHRLLMTKILRAFKRICARSLRRKQVKLKQIAQSQRRKSHLMKALQELEASDSSGRKPRRQLYRSRVLESEDALEDILVKVFACPPVTQCRRLKNRKNYGNRWSWVE